MKNPYKIFSLVLLTGAAFLALGAGWIGNLEVKNGSSSTTVTIDTLAARATLALKTASGTINFYKAEGSECFYMDRPLWGTTLKATSIIGAVTGNASTATKLETARLFTVTDNDATNSQAAASSFDGSAAYTVKLPATVKASLTGNVTGNASTATKLETARLFTVTDNDGTNSQAAATSFDGSAAYTVKLPATVKASLTGNVTGNCSGTSATVTGATQAAITTCANLTTVGTISHNLAIAATKCYLIGSQQMIRFYGTGTSIYGDGGGSLNNTTGTEGYYNTFVGGLAGSAATLTTLSTAVGYNALASLTTGANNTGIGSSALRNVNIQADNIGVGTNAGRYYNSSLQCRPTQCVFLGSETEGSQLAAVNQIVIGYNAYGVADNSITLGNTDIGAIYCKVSAITSTSDVSDKEAIEEWSEGLGADFISKLKPKTFKYKDDTTHLKRLGLVAQDVIAAAGKDIPELTPTLGDTGKKGITYGNLIMPLINAVKELKQENDDLKQRIKQLEKK